MAYKPEKAVEGYRSNLALFHTPPVDTGSSGSEWQEYRPTSQISKGAPLEFSVTGNSSHYIDLKRTRLYLKCRITKPDGTAITKEDHVGLVNIPLHSMFRQVEMSLQHEVISSGVGLNYPYKATFDTLLHYGAESKDSQRQSELYFKDTAGFMSSIPGDDGNVGLSERRLWTDEGKYVDLEGSLFLDIMEQSRLIINGVSIELKMMPSGNAFALMCDGTEPYHFEISEAVLKVCNVRVNPGVLVGHAEAIKHNPAIYPYQRSAVKAYNIPQGVYSWTMDDIFQGQIPGHVVIGLVLGSAYNGKYELNPFDFQHFDVNFLGFFVDGQSIPTRPYSQLQSESVCAGVPKSLHINRKIWTRYWELYREE